MASPAGIIMTPGTLAGSRELGLPVVLQQSKDGGILPLQGQVCRGMWARVTIDQFRHLALQTVKKHRAPSNIFSLQVASSRSPVLDSRKMTAGPIDRTVVLAQQREATVQASNMTLGPLTVDQLGAAASLHTDNATSIANRQPDDPEGLSASRRQSAFLERKRRFTPNKQQRLLIQEQRDKSFRTSPYRNFAF